LILYFRCVDALREIDAVRPTPSVRDRWTGGSSESGLYTSDAEVGALAEFVKHREMDGINPFDILSTGQREIVRVGNAEVNVTDFLDALDPTVMATVGITDPLGYTIDYDATITVAQAFLSPRAAWDIVLKNGKTGLTGPSAAYRGANTFLIRASEVARLVGDFTTSLLEIPARLENDPNRVKGIPL